MTERKEWKEGGEGWHNSNHYATRTRTKGGCYIWQYATMAITATYLEMNKKIH